MCDDTQVNNLSFSYLTSFSPLSLLPSNYRPSPPREKSVSTGKLDKKNLLLLLLTDAKRIFCYFSIRIRKFLLIIYSFLPAPVSSPPRPLISLSPLPSHLSKQFHPNIVRSTFLFHWFLNLWKRNAPEREKAKVGRLKLSERNKGNKLPGILNMRTSEA